MSELEDQARRIRELEAEVKRWKPDPNRATLERAEVEAQRLGRMLKGAMPPGWGFVLGLFTFGPEGFVTYLSSADRTDTIRLLRELANNVEAGAPQA